MPRKGNPKDVALDVNGITIRIRLAYEGFELYADGTLHDQYKGIGFAIPFVQTTRLVAEPTPGTRIEAHVRNMGVGFRLEVRHNGRMIYSELFAQMIRSARQAIKLSRED